MLHRSLSLDVSQGAVQGLGRGPHRSDAGAEGKLPAQGPEEERPVRCSPGRSSPAFQGFR